LVSLSKTSPDYSTGNEIQEVEQTLENINHELHSMETILPSTTDNNPSIQLTSPKLKSSKNKMRETLYRIARPFDQQFSLHICFNHQYLDKNIFPDDEIEERFQDLHRITKNVIQFFILEPETIDEENRDLLNKAESYLPDLLQNEISFHQRIEIYNYCLQIIEYFQPIIRYYVQRTDLMDII
jgi:hypothetical protein